MFHFASKKSNSRCLERSVFMLSQLQRMSWVPKITCSHYSEKELNKNAILLTWKKKIFGCEDPKFQFESFFSFLKAPGYFFLLISWQWYLKLIWGSLFFGNHKKTIENISCAQQEKHIFGNEKAIHYDAICLCLCCQPVFETKTLLKCIQIDIFPNNNTSKIYFSLTMNKIGTSPISFASNLF